MTRQIKAFVTCDRHINNAPGSVEPLYELSTIGLTYAKEKQQYYSQEMPEYSLYVFKQIDQTGMTQSEVDTVLNVVRRFTDFASANTHLDKPALIIGFLSQHNLLYPDYPVTDLSPMTMVVTGNLVGPDFLSFTVRGIQCSIWLSDSTFRGFYTDYEISIVFPFEDFQVSVQNGAAMVTALNSFSLVEFNGRIEQDKGLYPTTHTKILNIPYHLPGSTVVRDCHFAFNQYGSQGNYDHVLKLYLYQYLLDLGLTSAYIETIFPTILKINEFFVTPRWNKMAIPSHVGEHGIRTQVAKAFSEEFDLQKYVKVYTDLEYLKANSYNVPFDYNNILLTVSNGYYTEEHIKDFVTQYPDIITVSSTHPDFARMRPKTMRLLTLLESMLRITDSDNTVEMFSKMMANPNYVFTMINRQGVWYLSFLYEGHQIYVIPRYEYTALLNS
ncbi:MAG: hypothetical protein PHN51_11975 [Candidatus Nanopelagicales bacterium]|nr:hypothetical protein [Candidatus Nanopelagicales bacterium]